MPSRSEPAALDSQAALKTALLLLSVSLNALEFCIPRIPLLPWLKPGLANIVTIVWLLRFGPLDTLLFSALRIWIVGFYFGFSILSLVLGLSGSIAAVLSMGLAWRLFGRRGLIGTIGLGMLGAVAHNAGQLAAVYLLLARNPYVLYQIPLMALASALAGATVGLLSFSLLDLPQPAPLPLRIRPAAIAGGDAWRGAACLGLLGWSVLVMWVREPVLLLGHALAATALVQLHRRGSLAALLAPLRSFWLLLLMVAAIHLFFSYGQRIPALRLVTYEGAREAARQLLRLWTWLQLSQILRAAGFGPWSMAVLERLLPRRRETLTAGIAALEFFPETIAWARQAIGPAVRALARSPRNAIRSFAADLLRDLLSRLERSAATAD